MTAQETTTATPMTTAPKVASTKMTRAWHPAAITVPVAAAALMAATSWAVAGNSASTTANAAPVSSQHAQVRQLNRAIDSQRVTLRQLESAITQTKTQIKQEKQAAAAALRPLTKHRRR